MRGQGNFVGLIVAYFNSQYKFKIMKTQKESSKIAGAHPYMKPTIKFSHCYPKLLDRQGKMITSAILLACIPVDLYDISQEMREYDTSYLATEGKLEEYPLPRKGAYLLLIFKKPGGFDLFTTLRSAFPTSKVEYYTKKVGFEFDVKIGKFN